MNKLQTSAFLLLVFWLLSSCSSDDGTPPIETPLQPETILNVSYGSHPQQVYDLYLPAGRTVSDTRVIMLIHGGGWTSGDKSDMNGTVTVLKNLHPEYAIVNVNYVLADAQNYAFPNQFLDIQSIISKLVSESGALHINPEFGLIGTSAGAHIAMMYDYQYDTQGRVKFVADIVGPSDFTDPFYEENFDLPMAVQAMVDPEVYPEGTDYLVELSPAFHVSPSSSPTCMFYGTHDPLVPATNGTTLQQRLNQAGVDNTLRIYQGGHGNDWSNQDLFEAQEIISEYIQAYL